MATRRGATKTDARGRRFRWNGRKWVQIKAQGNGGNTTSSRTRRARQNRSNARITRDKVRTSTGVAKVTGGEKPQLPPASQTRSGSGTNNRPGTRTTGQGGRPVPVRTGAKITRDKPRVITNLAEVTKGKETPPPAKPKAKPPKPPTPSKAALDAATKRALASQPIPGFGGGTGGRVGKGLLALDAVLTASDLIQSIARGEGYGAIPRLLRQGGQANLGSTGGGRQYDPTLRNPTGLSNIPPAEGPLNNPQFGQPGELPMSRPTLPTQPPAPLSVQQPSAPVNEGMTPTGGSMPAPEPSSAPSQANQFAGMSEAELMRVWAKNFPGLAAKLTQDDYGMEFLETPEQRRRRMMKGYPGNQNY